MENRNTLNRLSQGIIVALGISAAPFVSAQDTVEKDADTVEQISVVGSRIRTDSFANDTPIDIISVADAENQGLKSLGELLRTSTAAAGSNQLKRPLHYS